MKVSIAMATYNGEKFILEQLESFVKQRRQPDELIVTDDCSNDKTIEIIEEFKKQAPFVVKIYRNETNLGYTQNFNRALELCTGELILLSDQDDVWFPTKIEYILGLTVQYPDKALFMIDTKLTDETLKESEFSKQGQIKDLGLADSSFVMGCCIAIKQNLLKPILPIPNTFTGHDNWLVKIADILNLRHIDNSIQQYYRIHGNNTSTFIGNNLAKMEKPKITFRKKIVAWLKISKLSVFNDFINKNSNFIEPLERLTKRQYSPIAEIALNSIKNNIELNKKRLNIVESKNIFDRITKSFKLYFSGGYDAFNGLKSCLSDILRD